MAQVSTEVTVLLMDGKGRTGDYWRGVLERVIEEADGDIIDIEEEEC